MLVSGLRKPRVFFAASFGCWEKFEEEAWIRATTKKHFDKNAKTSMYQANWRKDYTQLTLRHLWWKGTDDVHHPCVPLLSLIPQVFPLDFVIHRLCLSGVLSIRLVGIFAFTFDRRGRRRGRNTGGRRGWGAQSKWSGQAGVDLQDRSCSVWLDPDDFFWRRLWKSDGTKSL